MTSPCILVVDDEPGIAMLCKRLLSRDGYEVETYTDPHEAVRYLTRHHIDLLLVDIRMPEVDGFEVIEHTQKLQPDAAVLIMTGYGTVETAIRALRQGVDGLILKPFGQGRELIEAVKQAFADSQQKRDAARTQALRPLFSVTESLLSETRREHLPRLVVNAICDQLRCPDAAYYQQDLIATSLKLLSSQGKTLPDEPTGGVNDLIAKVDIAGIPLLINAGGPGEPELKRLLSDLKLGALILVPIIRSRFRIVLYAAREAFEPPFHDSDLEMFQILARQAAVAMENAGLYAELMDYVRKVEDSQKALLQAEKMATAGRLSASIAHEVNNPLQSIQNCLHLAGRDDVSPEKRKEYFDLARVEVERLTLTVQRMLDFYRPGTASQEKIDPVEVLKYVLNLMSKQLNEARVNVEYQVDGNIPRIMAVSSQLQQVYINLILNAMDAMHDGGTLKISIRGYRDGVEIMFQDNGPGIPAANQADIFEPFFSTKERGTGLGLTVSYNIVTAHGGTLEFLADRSPGAWFRLLFPIGG
jgi:signal transduction histidine kinase/CheY-like chemotaxis protein